jgi:type I restriction enzyme, S subunit
VLDRCTFISHEDFTRLSRRYTPLPGDVIVTCVGTLGQTAIVPEGISFSADRNLAAIRPSEAILSSFLKAALDAPKSQGVMQSGSGSTAQPHLYLGDLRELKIPVPPLAEQKRIVAAIEEQFSRLDAGVAALERACQNLKRMRAAELQAAVRGRLVHQDPAEGTGTDFLAMVTQRRGGARSPVAASADLPVPETWAVASLEAVTDPHRVICYGILMPKVREGGTVPYVEVKDLRARRLEVAALHRTSAALHNEFSRSQLNAGDVVLAIRGSYDRALVVPAEVAGANVSRDVARIAPVPGLVASFVAAYLMSAPALQYLRQRARGVAVKGVNISDLRSMPIPVPPAEEQKRIVRELDRIDSIIGELESVLDSERARTRTLRSSILAAAFSGNLLPQDPLDEPASLLLERIAAERAPFNGRSPARTRKPRTAQERVVV